MGPYEHGDVRHCFVCTERCTQTVRSRFTGLHTCLWIYLYIYQYDLVAHGFYQPNNVLVKDGEKTEAPSPYTCFVRSHI